MRGMGNGVTPFRFEKMLLREECFKYLFNGWGMGYNFRGSYSFILAMKLKALKSYLKIWNKEVFRNVSINLFERSLKATFLVLVPMKGGAKDLKNFRPISLARGLYKLLAKVLNNLKGWWVPWSQIFNMLLGGGWILNVVLIANGVIDSKLEEKLRGILCKLDIEKAYGHINWSFVLALMGKMRFGSKWLGWMRWCISTTCFFILVDDTP